MVVQRRCCYWGLALLLRIPPTPVATTATAVLRTMVGWSVPKATQRRGAMPVRQLASMPASVHNENNAENPAQQHHSPLRLIIPTAQDMEEVGAVLAYLLCHNKGDDRTKGAAVLLDGDLGEWQSS
jgi:hypothetical protein